MRPDGGRRGACNGAAEEESCCTLRDAVHDLPGHLEAGRQTGRERRGEVDGHSVVETIAVAADVDVDVRSHSQGARHRHAPHGTVTGRSARDALGGDAAASAAAASAASIGATRTRRAALTAEPAAYDFAQVSARRWRGCRRWWVGGVGVGCRRPHGSISRDEEPAALLPPFSARLAALHHPPHPLRPMHVHRAGLLHPNQYHTLSQKTDPT